MVSQLTPKRLMTRLHLVQKPSEGKTNKYRLKGDKGAIQVQVSNKGGSKPFELNMYKEEVELDEAPKEILDKLLSGDKRSWRED